LLNGFVKIGRHCVELPLFSDAVRRRAGHGRPGEPLHTLAKTLQQSDSAWSAILLGAGFGETLADLSRPEIGRVLCREAREECQELLARNTSLMGGVGPAPPQLAFPELLARFASFRDARLLVVGASEDVPSTIETALSWIRERRPILALEMSLADGQSRQHWMTTLAALRALDYEVTLAFDHLEHLLGGLAPEDLLAYLDSARCRGGGLPSAKLFMGAAGDRAVLANVRSALEIPGGRASVHRIAVVRMDNLGDHVLGAGLFAALRTCFPASKLVAVVPAQLCELYARCPYIDATLSLPPWRDYISQTELTQQLEAHLRACAPFDLVVHPRFAEDFYVAGWICSKLAAPGGRVLGFRQARSPVARYNPNEHYNQLLDAPDTWHTARYTGVVAEAATGSPATAAPEVWFEPEDWTRVASRFALQARQFIAVGVGASVRFKVPPPQIYLGLLRRLLEESLQVVIVGSAAESDFVAGLVAAFPGQPLICMAGSLRLYELAALLAHARLYVGPDAGPKHVAAASGTPVLELGWVPLDFPATSRGEVPVGRCWDAWNTTTRIVSPSREVFEQARRATGIQDMHITGLDPAELDRVVGQMLDASPWKN
jgi:ADP-heptose:LPS heptosyltransferase